MKRALQKGFEVASEGETLIIKRDSTKISFDKKMAKNPAKDLYLQPSPTRTQTTPLFLAPDKRRPEENSAVQIEWADIKKQENTKTTKIATQNNYANKLHAKLSHLWYDTMRMTENHLYYRVKRELDFRE